MSSYNMKKIIVVEDSMFSRAIIVSRLKRLGFSNITSPESSIESWELIANSQLSDEPFDLVITDLNMPELDGMDLIDKIKSDSFSEMIPIIVISADADQLIKNIVLKMGASSYLTKPLDMGEFINALQDVFNEKIIFDIAS